MEQPFDYIVVGAGSAGCVLANRLTEDAATRVLLIEAGGRDRSPNIKIPAAFAKQFHTRLDWDFSTEPEPHVDGRSLYVPRGKSLGGSSSMNAMLYVRGRPLDYDLWEKQGAVGWGWQDVLPYFLKSEDDVRGASEFHGAGGPLRVSNQRSPRANVDRRLIAASEAAGIPRSHDYNGPEQDGVAMFQVNQRDGRRWSAADAFLRPALERPNLEVMTRTRVLRVEFEGGRAVGVRIARGRRERSIRAEREVILSAGSVQSPQLLLLSGIGSADDLRAVGVDVRARPTRSRAQPAGPPVRHAHLGGLRPGHPLRRRQAQAARRVGAAPHRPADVERRRSRRVRAHPRRPARGRRPVPYGRRVLRGSRRGDLRWPLRGDRARARVTAVTRPSLAAIGGSHRDAAHDHEQPVRARRPAIARRRHGACA